MANNTKTKLNGQRGEYLTLAKFAELGYLASKLDDGSALVDIAVVNPETLDAVSVQVKTADGVSKKNPFWMMSKKNERHYANLWFVLVDLTPTGPEFYVFHSSVIGPRIAKKHADYISEPMRNGGQRKDSSVRKFFPTPEELAAAKDAFHQMFV